MKTLIHSTVIQISHHRSRMDLFMKAFWSQSKDKMHILVLYVHLSRNKPSHVLRNWYKMAVMTVTQQNLTEDLCERNRNGFSHNLITLYDARYYYYKIVACSVSNNRQPSRFFNGSQNPTSPTCSYAPAYGTHMQSSHQVTHACMCVCLCLCTCMFVHVFMRM